ncbi:MAG: NUDIX domain-containing protein [Alphaproteobacteria bacterium]|nr:NUDIX domain-containing protein [Alphaproteobacteria bacterium]MBV9693478.1 NUDIX domain-containing protein [Alphaproteobacteria bacterium]
MAQVSAGIVLFRGPAGEREVFLIHPGGPFWARKDEGAWSIPKGLVDAGEDELACARREFAEETGFEAKGPARDLGSFRMPGGKRLRVWAVGGDADPAQLRSNLFEMEWPPRSGRRARFPEADRGGWFGRDTALAKIVKGQRAVLEAFFKG